MKPITFEELSPTAQSQVRDFCLKEGSHTIIAFMGTVNKIREGFDGVEVAGE